jgi:hypothetical protein
MTMAAPDVVQACTPNLVTNPGFETGNNTGWGSDFGIRPTILTDNPKEGTGYDAETWESKKGTEIDDCLPLERL